jgi:hypothetical protein
MIRAGALERKKRHQDQQILQAFILNEARVAIDQAISNV